MVLCIAGVLLLLYDHCHVCISDGDVLSKFAFIEISLKRYCDGYCADQ